MSTDPRVEPAAPDLDKEPVTISTEALRKAESFVEAEEGATNRLGGWAGRTVTAIAVAMTLFHLYAAYGIVPTQELRYTHVAFVLLLSFLLFPFSARYRNRIRIRWWDVIPALVSVGIIVYALAGGEDFTDRATGPDRWDVILGVIFIVLLLEATRRTTGPIMPVVSLMFIAYAMLGPYLPAPWTHRGYDLPRLVGHLFITLEGIFGVAVDVSATLIILFTIYGAFLQQSGAGKFFIDFSLGLMGGKANSAGRTVVLSSFLLGGPSGSGVATTVMIGTVAYPMMARAGFEKNAAGGLLAAGGLGAILSPPGARSRRLPDRRVPEDQLPRRHLDGDDPDLPLLPVAPDHGRARRQAVRRPRRRFQAGPHARADDPAVLVPLRLAHQRRRLHGRRLLADALGLLRGRGHFRAQLPASRHGSGAAKAGPGDGRWVDRRPGRGDDLRLGGHRRRHRHADGPRPEILLHRHRLRRR